MDDVGHHLHQLVVHHVARDGVRAVPKGRAEGQVNHDGGQGVDVGGGDGPRAVAASVAQLSGRVIIGDVGGVVARLVNLDSFVFLRGNVLFQVIVAAEGAVAHRVTTAPRVALTSVGLVVADHSVPALVRGEGQRGVDLVEAIVQFAVVNPVERAAALHELHHGVEHPQGFPGGYKCDNITVDARFMKPNTNLHQKVSI